MLKQTRGLKNSNIRRFTDLCNARKAVNLAQGLCHVECSAIKLKAIEAYKEALDKGKTLPGFDTYVSYKGIPILLQRIAEKARAYNKFSEIDPGNPGRNIMVTAGALGAFNCALEAFLEPGDEAILFQPYYSFYRDQLLVKHMVPRAVTLRPPHWAFTREDLEAVVSARTRAIVVNTPGNPTGKVFRQDELALIADFCHDHDLIAITDEVYEFMVFDGLQHISLATLPGMWERTVTISSFGKMLSATGWRIGYVIAPEELIREMGYSNEFETACASAPAQWAVAAALEDLEPFLALGQVFQRKRDLLCCALDKAGFHFQKPSGAVYVLVDVASLMSSWNLTTSEEVTLRLIENPGIGTVPAEDFYLDDSGSRQVRFCFAVFDGLLRDAEERLASLQIEAAQIRSTKRG